MAEEHDKERALRDVPGGRASTEQFQREQEDVEEAASARGEDHAPGDAGATNPPERLLEEARDALREFGGRDRAT
jgi:hypothetical protein